MNEWKQAGNVTGDALEAIVRIVADTHEAVGARVDSSLPAPAKPFNRLHLMGARSVYSVVGAAHKHVPRALSGLGALSEKTPAQTAPGRVVLPVVNGFHGDLLAREHPGLAVPMTLRVESVDSGHLVVFVHGLAEDDRAWWLRGPSYGDQLPRVACVYVRYNSGLPIADNAAALSANLEQLVGEWPMPVESVSLVGHSMGGLVAHAASRLDGAWTEQLRSVITLGTPHGGAPLEKVVHVAETVMAAIPESAPIGRILASRSAGVRDLRHGIPPEELRPGVGYYWVAATLTKDPDHPMGRLIGDGMVRRRSASGIDAEGVCLGGVGHLDLLGDEAVLAALREWLT